jgi:hypothetical protein
MKGGTRGNIVLSLGELFPMTVMKPYEVVNMRLRYPGNLSTGKK